MKKSSAIQWPGLVLRLRNSFDPWFCKIGFIKLPIKDSLTLVKDSFPLVKDSFPATQRLQAKGIAGVKRKRNNWGFLEAFKL
jgi:hypothetical protein